MRINGDYCKVMGIYNKNKGVDKMTSANSLKGKKDVVSISNNAKDFQTALKEVKNTPDIREEKVSEIQKNFSNGNYDVPAKDLAEKMANSFFRQKL